MTFTRVVMVLAFLLIPAGASADEELACFLEAETLALPDVVEPAPEPMTCEFGGHWTCPDDGMTFDYGPAPISYCQCGPLSTTAYGWCQNYCDAPCYDSGWVDPCYPT